MKRIFNNSYSSFKNALKEILCKIPVDGTTYVPQGLCSIDNVIIMACYDYQLKNNSILFLYDKGNLKRIYLDSKIHCGGISYHKATDSLFITGVGYQEKSFINKYCGKDVLKAKDLSTVYVQKMFCVDDNNTFYSSSAKHSSPAYLSIYKDSLFVGNYVDCDDFDKHKCMIKKYRILSNGDLSISNDIINNPFSNTQGLCVFDYNKKTYYLFSRSFGRKRNSIINICSYDETTGFTCHNSIVLPSMLEQINNYQNNIVAIFESCAECYSNNCITYNDSVYLLDFGKLLKCDDDLNTYNRGKKLFAKTKNVDLKGICGQKSSNMI